MSYKYFGGCHCGNVVLEIDITAEPNSYKPRTCDCSFCRKHGASYISDKNGTLIISINDENDLRKYQQGSGIADFLFCRVCGVLAGVCFTEQEHLYAAINCKAIDQNADFGKDVVGSPQELNDNKKIERWKDVWFSDVQIKVISK